jgi:excisionase family DNA binding protein
MDEERLTARSGEVARALGVSNATVQAYARAGRIPFRLTPGKQYRFDIADVRAVLGRDELQSDDLVDLGSGAGVIVDELTGFRETSMSEAAVSRLRARAAVVEAAGSAHLRAGDGSSALKQLATRSRGVAVAVLPRDPVGA